MTKVRKILLRSSRVPLVRASTLALLISIFSSLSYSWAQAQETPIVQSVTRINPGSYVSWPLRVDTYIRNGRIAGNIQESAGSTVRAFVMDEKQFEAWRRQPGGQPKALFNSGLRRSIVLSVPISDPGTYYVLFDNTFSIFATKAVSANIRLIHEGIDEARIMELERRAGERERRVGQILGRLVTTLQEMESEWGTRQILPPIYLTINPAEGGLNAFADPSRRLVGVTRGTLEFAESLAAREGDSMIAGVLGHELGHIFYRHAYGEPNHQGAAAAGLAGAAMVHPLVGLIGWLLASDYPHTYDRQQETEADILGVRLACAAGYDPAGFLLFIGKAREADPSQSGFLRTHPSPAQRMQYLQEEVTRGRCLRELPR